MSNEQEIKTYQKICVSGLSDIEKQITDLNIYEVKSIKDLKLLKKIKEKLGKTEDMIINISNMIFEYEYCFDPNDSEHEPTTSRTIF